MDSPLISVILPVYNGERYLAEALESVLAQTFKDFELIAIDDCSVDATPRILEEFASRDPRVKVLTNQENLRIVGTLNRGLDEARGKFIARMDADDVSYPERFEKQIAFLTAHPDHILVGTSYRSIDAYGKARFVRRGGLDHEQARWISRFRIPMTHPSFMFRRLLPDGAPLRYDPATPVAEDFALVSRILDHGKVAVLDDVLLDYRMHAANISSTNTANMRADTLIVARPNLEAAYPEDIAIRLEALVASLHGLQAPTAASLRQGAETLREVIALDTSRRGPEKSWMTRRAAGILAEAHIGREKGLKRIGLAASFVAHARDFVLPLLARFAETRGIRFCRSGAASALSLEHRSNAAKVPN